MSNNENEIILLTDKQWSVVEGELCNVIRFNPLVGYIEGGKVKSVDSRTPYGSIAIKCKKIPQEITGFITNKLDFLNLWKALKERNLKVDEEVIIIWSKAHKYKILNILLSFMPKLHIMICPKGLWNKIASEDWDIDTVKFALNENKIAEWKLET